MAAKRSRWTHMAALVAGAAVIGAGVSGCGLGRALGVSKSAPDEFAVVTKAPLVLPPDYELRPPKPGEKRPQELEPSEAAKQALFRNQSSGTATAPMANPAPTTGEQALLASAGANQADAAGSEQTDTDNKHLVRKSESFSNKLLFGNENAIPASAVNTAAKSEQPNPAAAENSGEAADEGTDDAEDAEESEDEAEGAEDAEAKEGSEAEGTDEAAEGENEAGAEGTDEATGEDTGDSGGEDADESADDEADDAGEEPEDDSGSQE